MHEIILNIHMHTRFSDGTGTHQDIGEAAASVGIDAVAVTDHNVLVQGKEGFIYRDGHRVLMMVGEEIHNQDLLPQKNHLIVIGADRELAHLAHDLELLLDGVAKAGGIAFLAHPDDPEALSVGETAITWEEWEIDKFHGIEIWNGLSEFKRHINSKFDAFRLALRPERIAEGPFVETLSRWDRLLSSGKKVVAVGGSDAHALKFSLGPFRRKIFPYEWHFQGINTHILLDSPLHEEYEEAKKQILSTLLSGRAFIGYDLPASTNGFRFSANGLNGNLSMGSETSAKNGVTFQIKLPRPEKCSLIKDGQFIKSWENREICSYSTSEPGVYRVEVTIFYKGKRRGWIYSNPIYVTP